MEQEWQESIKCSRDGKKDGVTDMDELFQWSHGVRQMSG